MDIRKHDKISKDRKQTQQSYVNIRKNVKLNDDVNVNLANEDIAITLPIAAVVHGEHGSFELAEFC